MQLLSLEPADCQHLCYAPPFEREAWRARWALWSAWARCGCRWPAAYAISAVEVRARHAPAGPTLEPADPGAAGWVAVCPAA